MGQSLDCELYKLFSACPYTLAGVVDLELKQFGKHFLSVAEYVINAHINFALS